MQRRNRSGYSEQRKRISHKVNYFLKTVKTSRESVSASDHKLVYVRWPQEAIFIDFGKKRVRYDKLSQSQWAAGLTTMVAKEPNVTIQMNILSYMPSLLQDVCDFRLPSRLQFFLRR